MTKIDDAIREWIAGETARLEERLLFGNAATTNVDNGVMTTNAGTPSAPIDLASILSQIEGPWGQHVVAQRIECCEFAERFLRGHPALRLQNNLAPIATFAGIEVRVDKSAPLGRVRFVNKDGLTIEEFYVAADSLT